MNQLTLGPPETKAYVRNPSELLTLGTEYLRKFEKI